MANDGIAAPSVGSIKSIPDVDELLEDDEEHSPEAGGGGNVLNIDDSLIKTDQVVNPGLDNEVMVDVDAPARRLNDNDSEEDIENLDEE